MLHARLARRVVVETPPGPARRESATAANPRATNPITIPITIPTMIAFYVLAGLVVLRWGLLAFGAALVIKPVDDCPACFRPTFLLRRPWLRRLAPWLEWRWCPRCGWQGLAKATRQPLRIRTEERRRAG